ncbi:hypothetical protein [Prosthecobacter sp.]|uniref:hypothetical protein n=1 Tax=Prosthecobacter sp. TaxID=1965333 RepID=UPI002ABB8E1F|nr:hypothetical protein [Prosthecobacter sp.]MDZ4404900.1 hypothetical protein [Prosthecobacter sp.]
MQTRPASGCARRGAQACSQHRQAARRVERSGSHLARIIDGMIKSGKAYDENEAFKVTPSSQARRLLNLHKQAAKLGLQLVPAV